MNLPGWWWVFNDHLGTWKFPVLQLGASSLRRWICMSKELGRWSGWSGFKSLHWIHNYRWWHHRHSVAEVYYQAHRRAEVEPALKSLKQMSHSAQDDGIPPNKSNPIPGFEYILLDYCSILGRFLSISRSLLLYPFCSYIRGIARLCSILFLLLFLFCCCISAYHITILDRPSLDSNFCWAKHCRWLWVLNTRDASGCWADGSAPWWFHKFPCHPW